jgi:hypothetical protein
MAQSHWNFSNLPDRDTEPEPPSSLGALEEPTPREPEPLTQRYNFSNLPDLEEPEARPAFEQGNVNLFNRPKVQNPDGTISTVRSMSFQDDDGREVLVPTVSDDGRIMGDDEAIAQYRESGKHLGKFTDIDSANRYAETLHDEYEQGVYDEVPKSWWEWGSDLLIGGAKGVIGVGEAAVGLIDIPTLGHAGKFMEERRSRSSRATSRRPRGERRPGSRRRRGSGSRSRPSRTSRSRSSARRWLSRLRSWVRAVSLGELSLAHSARSPAVPSVRA